MNAEDFVSRYFAVDDPNVASEIAKHLEKKTFQKGQFLAEPGKMITELYFLIKGTAIFYAYQENGERGIPCVESHPGGILVPDFEWLSEKPSTQYGEVMCETEVYAISLTDLVELQQAFPKEVNNIFLLYTKKSFDGHMKHKMMLALPSKQRVQWFEKNYPEAQMKTEDIANFLNMTREHYSKTRMKIAEEK